ncbi:hypothetical protein [Rhizorhabdus argentea]|uniref:hypothetical protein n=1 Tax=Rhizorhabdus argentea TaxID=1387174 RepID=UPI0030EC02AB
MNTHFWIPFSISAACVLFFPVMCYGHRRPVVIDHDLPEASRSDMSQFKIVDFNDLRYANRTGAAYWGCSKEYEFVYLYTEKNPEFVAYRVKDVCDIRKCDCTIKVSYLENRRHDLAVPWQKAGNILPKGVRRW